MTESLNTLKGISINSSAKTTGKYYENEILLFPSFERQSLIQGQNRLSRIVALRFESRLNHAIT